MQEITNMHSTYAHNGAEITFKSVINKQKKQQKATTAQ